MKTKLLNIIPALVLLALATFNSQLTTANAQGTAFTYQGRLNTNGTPVNGLYDFQFTLENAPSGGMTVGSPQAVNAVSVTNGLFTVTLDFGNVFAGSPTWLLIQVRTNGAGPGYATLTPLQQLTPTPYAIYAENAATVSAASITASQFNTSGLPSSGSVLGYNGRSLIWENPTTPFPSWSLTCNSGTAAGREYVGTSDNQPLEIKVNNTRALRLEPTTGASNFIAGSPASQAIGGAGGFASGEFAAIGGGYLALAFLAGVQRVSAQASLFTYQGRLDSNGTPVSGSFDIQFTLYAGRLIDCGAQHTHISEGGSVGRK